VADLEEARQRWLTESPIYARFVDHVVAILRAKFRNPAIDIYGRPKELDSLLKKLILKSTKTYDDLSDKAGVRVVVKFTEEITLVERFIEERFPDHKKDDKKAALATNLLGYQGVHYDIKLKDGEAKDTEFANLWMEVQVRTLAQHLWSDMSHELGYKPELPMPPAGLRRLNRLSAVVEIADDEFSALHKALHEMPEYNAYKVLRLLEARFYQFAAVAYDKDLSLHTIEAFNHLYGDGGLAEQQDQFDQFCVKERQRLEHIFNLYKGTDHHPLFLFQPEALMIFQLINQDKFKLREEWIRLYPYEELEILALRWGDPYVS
jgi:ppGpp synthetase/RelA/SpoT-type nucleotidyltranferase